VYVSFFPVERALNEAPSISVASVLQRLTNETVPSFFDRGEDISSLTLGEGISSLPLSSPPRHLFGQATLPNGMVTKTKILRSLKKKK
jgi:hypothetical protein